ncbi:DUF262 domain-containing protein [Shewanella yunxiaonensis]|uniref:DUF262 domain-containing protein n=1 Tax=Shewanella yunxiaonensis TaxID=2829809 RepID=A0ABX7YRI7_9GAMM|nr:DUF262 domain-containing protein [Shewanella yunxiaonensis]QUN04791.1 DUF262 domain-containing protein [Shewanella yunxiaonensis]
MKNNDKDLQSLPIKKLFEPLSRYVIPIYQRNYAWGAPEIEQLIRDIYDAADKDVTGEQAKDYFLGSLVVYERERQPSLQVQVYETIDGQQRHTTLSILLAYLKNQQWLTQSGLEGLELNLTFDSRPKSERALNDLYENAGNGESEEPSIHAAYDIIDRYFKTKKLDIAVFCQYLLEHVVILRVSVPKDTDLNHYFEIMNNRGEQLEKHEVLKANLMSVYADNQPARDCFSAIWDACANMKRYVQLGFEPSIRTAVFGDKWQAFPSDFSEIQQHFSEAKQSEQDITLLNIIRDKKRFDKTDDLENEKEERFESIIDFSNFLLHVLKITVDDNVSLDDKKLLEAFYDDAHQLEVEPSEFVFNLLKYRILFDRYIVKRDFDEKWSLLTLEKYSESFSYVNSFGKDESNEVNQQLAMILSMFHVSNPALIYKRWLNDALAILGRLTGRDTLDVGGEDYLSALERLSDRYFEEICCPDGTFNKSVLDAGTGVQNFIFNRLDYLLWKRLVKGETFDGIGRAALGKQLDDFQFSFRTSVEHYFPQKDPSGHEAMSDVDRFGNLCLISPSNNSKLSNYSPADKKKFYRENKRAESLKQAIMMSYEDWGPDGAGYDNIKNHEKEMINVLRRQATTICGRV